MKQGLTDACFSVRISYGDVPASSLDNSSISCTLDMVAKQIYTAPPRTIARKLQSQSEHSYVSA